MSGVYTVEPSHPAWKAYGDDDWNGATFWNWRRGLVGKWVLLKPPPDLAEETVREIAATIGSVAYYVEREGVTVHVLKHGTAGCGKAGVPGSWEKGHLWVGFNDPDVRATATCPDCRAAEGLPPPDKTLAG